MTITSSLRDPGRDKPCPYNNPVRIVTVKDSPVNAEIQRIKSRRRSAQVSMTALVLFSLSPKSLLEAANQSNGNAVAVDRPVQLILYGPPNSD